MHLVEYRDQLNMQFTEACTYLLSHTWTCARVTVVVLCVCVHICLSFCVFVTMLAASRKSGVIRLSMLFSS